MFKFKKNLSKILLLTLASISTIFLLSYFPMNLPPTDSELSYVKSQAPIFEDDKNETLKLHTFSGWNEIINNQKNPWRKQSMKILNTSGREEIIPVFSVKMDNHFIIAHCTYQTLKYQHHVSCINYRRKYNILPKQISQEDLVKRKDVYKIQYIYEQDVQTSNVNLVSFNHQEPETLKFREIILRIIQSFSFWFILNFLIFNLTIPFLKKRKIKKDKIKGIKNLDTLPIPVVIFSKRNKNR